MQRELAVPVRVDRLRRAARETVDDVVAVEEPLEIRIVTAPDAAPTSVAVTMRTPGHDFDLAVGFLFTEGILHAATEVERVSFCVDDFVEQQYNVVNVYLTPATSVDPGKLERRFYVTSSCGVCGKASLDALHVQGCGLVEGEWEVEAAWLRGLPARLRVAQRTFDQTGGLHAAALFNAGSDLVLTREDVGRHNAVDKVIGERLTAGAVPLRQQVLLVSGRTSFEIMQKAAVAGIPLVAAIGAPSSLAIATAEEFGMTLVGFVGPERCNLYAGGWRVRGV